MRRRLTLARAASQQQNTKDLIRREKNAGLNEDETSELDYFLKMEHLMRLAKVRARTFCPNE